MKKVEVVVNGTGYTRIACKRPSVRQSRATEAIINVCTLNTPQRVNFAQSHQQGLRVLTARGGVRRQMKQERTEEEEEEMGRPEKCMLLPIYP